MNTKNVFYDQDITHSCFHFLFVVDFNCFGSSLQRNLSSTVILELQQIVRRQHFSLALQTKSKNLK